MTIDEAFQSIVAAKPPVLYISGKTSTGKSTFGLKLRDELGYDIVELESVLLDIIKSHNLDEQSTFRKVFFEPGEREEKDLLFAATDKAIADALEKNSPVVIEGAVANTETLQRILQLASNLYFLYFHPAVIDTYIRNLTSRFMESSEDSYGGLPFKFWQIVDHEAFRTFCKTRELSDSLKNSIKQYALASQQESLTRLHEFQQKFDPIVVVEIR